MLPIPTTAAPADSGGFVTVPAAVTRRRFPLRLFSQELAVLLRAGVSLLEALRSLREKETSPFVAGVLDDMLQSLSTGQSLSTSLRLRPDAFDALFVAVVAASERTGQTESGLLQHASYLLWVERLRDKLVAASIYPATLLVAGSAVLVFLVLFVVPRFAGILETGGRDLPAASRALLAIGRFGDAHPWLSIGVAVALLAAPCWLGASRPCARPSSPAYGAHRGWAADCVFLRSRAFTEPQAC